ncbi:MAG TPA: hypothetical protein VKH36_04075 [Acidimicrobiia bacterium]|nr:hypothetical protein [Acidimicrobiia bacterium]
MTEPPRYPEHEHDTSGSADVESTPRQSIWTKVLVVVFGVLVALALVLHLVLGGGPRH